MLSIRKESFSKITHTITSLSHTYRERKETTLFTGYGHGELMKRVRRWMAGIYWTVDAEQVSQSYNLSKVLHEFHLKRKAVRSDNLCACRHFDHRTDCQRTWHSARCPVAGYSLPHLYDTRHKSKITFISCFEFPLFNSCLFALSCGCATTVGLYNYLQLSKYILQTQTRCFMHSLL